MTSTNPNTNPNSSPSRGLLFPNTRIGFSGGKERTPILNDSAVTLKIAFVGESGTPGVFDLLLTWGGGIIKDRVEWEVESSADEITWTTIANPGTDDTSLSVTLAADATSFYRIREASTTEAGEWSNSVQGWGRPAAPETLAATAASSTQINLSWKDNSTIDAGFVVERRSPAGSGSYSQIAIAPKVSGTGANGSYSDTGLSPGTQYEYRVAAWTPLVSSSFTTSASATTTQSGALSPSWSLDFSSGTPSGYTLTRASSGTYVDSSGYIASAATDVARLTHNSSGTRLGLLVEEQRANILPNSEDFATGWAGGACNVSTNAVNAPTNTLVADKVAANTTNAAHWLRRATSSPVVGTTYVFSVFFKAGGGNVSHVYLLLNGQVTAGDVNYSAKYNVTTGARTDTDSDNAPANTDSPTQAEDYGNGWWRAWIRMQNPTGSAGLRAMVGLSNVATGAIQPTFAGAAGDADFAYFWGAQVEASTTTPTAFIPTTTASVTRSADLAHVLDSSITSWGDPGALVIHFYPPGKAGTLLSTDDASTAQVGIEASSTTAARAFWSSGSTSTGTIGTGVQKAVHYWNGSTSKFCINGGTVQSGTNNLTIGNTDFVTLGAEATDSSGVPGTFSQYANCIIRKVEFYSGTLTDANLQTVTAPPTYNVEYLVIAGGGGGCRGGGGAGGYRTATGYSLTVGQSYTVTVGAGGGGGNGNAGPDAPNGNNSVFDTITSTGGGGGGYSNNTAPSGGSGGGGGASGSATRLGGAGTSGQGNAGGNQAHTTSPFPSGGGGGASAAGGNTTANNVSGNGGDGTSSSITGSAVTRAGGGGGANFSGGGTNGSGGAGGGGGATGGATNGTNGSANTGGGGGGTGSGTGGSGGSGVVILRMATANYSGTTTGSPTVTTSGSDTILTFNASGSYTA